jgi:peptidyl-prolyl cis-trans isomerase A (cyclophilin A)
MMSYSRHVRVVLSIACVALASCGGGTPEALDVASGPAPDTFRVAFETNRGTFVVEAVRAWAPHGVDRFYALTRAGFFDEDRFFRVIPGFVAQFGINDKPNVNERWDEKPIPDDSVHQSNARGALTFATEGPGTRTHQLFVNLADNPRLDKQGFAPIGRVVTGMEVVDSLYGGYEDAPVQRLIQRLGNSYLARMFPKLDYVKTARVIGS